MRALFGAGRPADDPDAEPPSTSSHPSSVELDAGGTKIACERSVASEKGSEADMISREC
jgi:hypothetical protein